MQMTDQKKTIESSTQEKIALRERDSEALIARPIGIIHTPMYSKFDAPPQPGIFPAPRGESVIELYREFGSEPALRDLAGFSHIWLIWWFHRNNSWRDVVQPPRGGSKKRGVYATRSPHRPNPIGMTVVPLIRISKRKIYVGDNDLIDGTPIFDIKPYLPRIDSIPDAREGWLAEIDDEEAIPPRYHLKICARAQRQLKWLEDQGVSFIEKAQSILERDPTPHRTRRIRKASGDRLRIGCGEWRIFYRIQDDEVLVEEIVPGYPLATLKGNTSVRNRAVMLEYYGLWVKE
jgi:tRNA (adenine37-N6)-methyltransferase